jgi:hypothetical protein
MDGWLHRHEDILSQSFLLGKSYVLGSEISDKRKECIITIASGTTYKSQFPLLPFIT